MATPTLTSETLMFSIDEAARATSLSPRFLRARIASGELAAVRIGRLVRLRPADLQAYIDAHLKTTTLPKD